VARHGHFACALARSIAASNSDWSRASHADCFAAPKPSTGPSQIMLNPDAYAAVPRCPRDRRRSFTAHTQETTVHTWNAVARLSGSDSRQKGDIICSRRTRSLGHSRYWPGPHLHGADDDASGSIAVLTLAEACRMV